MRQHISPTQIDMAFRCGEQYRRRYIEEEKVPPAIALLKGKSTHVGAEFNNRQKVDTRADFAAGLVVEYAVADYDEAAKGELSLSREEATVGREKVVGQGRDSLASMMAFYMKAIAPVIDPMLVEEKVEIPIPGLDHTLLGVMDVVDRHGHVRDLKTTSKKKQQSEADTSIQLTTYWLAYYHYFKKEPAGLDFDVLVDKKVPEHQVLTTVRDRTDVDVLAARFSMLEAMLRTGTFVPNTSGWWCSARFCGYHPTCKYASKRGGGDE